MHQVKCLCLEIIIALIITFFCLFLDGHSDRNASGEPADLFVFFERRSKRGVTLGEVSVSLFWLQNLLVLAKDRSIGNKSYPGPIGDVG